VGLYAGVGSPLGNARLNARVRALEGLLTAVLRRDPALLHTLLDEAAHPLPENTAEWTHLERSAQRGLLTTARYPEGLLAEHERGE
jgi:hypothetical protein